MIAPSGHRKRCLHDSLVPGINTHTKATRLANTYSSRSNPTALLALCCSLCQRRGSETQAVQILDESRVIHLVSPLATTLQYEMYPWKVSDLTIHATQNIYTNQIYLLVVNPPRFAYSLLIFSRLEMWEAAHVLENAENNTICLESI